jgi:uncharacterized membrane protein
MTNIHEVTRSEPAVRIPETMHFLPEFTPTPTLRGRTIHFDKSIATHRCGDGRVGQRCRPHHAVVASTLASHHRQPGDRASAIVHCGLGASETLLAKDTGAGGKILQVLAAQRGEDDETGGNHNDYRAFLCFLEGMLDPRAWRWLSCSFRFLYHSGNQGPIPVSFASIIAIALTVESGLRRERALAKLRKPAVQFNFAEITFNKRKGANMDKMIVTVFDSEKQAYEGERALKEMHDEGSIVLYAMAVIAKEPNGKVAVKQSADQGPVGTVLGTATGALVGLLGGPVGVAVGAAAGTLGGSLADLTNVGVGGDFLDEVSQSLRPGKAAVVAEVEERWVIPLDSRMEDLGGTVFRRSRRDVVDAQIERDGAALRADIDQLNAELKDASGKAKAKLQAKVDAAKQRLEYVKNRANSRADNLKKEADAKIKSLKEQATRAQGDMKAHFEKRAAEVKADYEARSRELSQAWASGMVL